MLLESLVEVGGDFKVDDPQSGEWLRKLENIDNWTPEDFDAFVRFFVQLDHSERTPGNERSWVHSASTPFLTRIPLQAMVRIVNRQDGPAATIIEKYCDWARNTAFAFHFSDTVCNRLVAIFDHGTPANKAIAFAALVALGESHNRWFIMRQMLRRASKEDTPKELARRLAIELKTDELERDFKRCVNVVGWELSLLAPDLARLCS
jgi:hypothetical protein